MQGNFLGKSLDSDELAPLEQFFSIAKPCLVHPNHLQDSRLVLLL